MTSLLDMIPSIEFSALSKQSACGWVYININSIYEMKLQPFDVTGDWTWLIP